jgi:hypothetical protein
VGWALAPGSRDSRFISLAEFVARPQADRSNRRVNWRLTYPGSKSLVNVSRRGASALKH